MNTGSKNGLLLKGTFFLSAAALFGKILSAVYRVPFQNLVGDVGFYIYQQVYPIYGVASALASVGFPVILSKRLTDGKIRPERLIPTALIVFFLFCGTIFLCLFGAATRIAAWMGDPGLASVIRTSSFLFLPLPFLSLLRGIFQSEVWMVPTALSQVCEQTVRVVFIFLFTAWFLSKGFSLYLVGAGAMGASLIGSFAALGVLSFFWKKERKSVKYSAKTFSWRISLPLALKILLEGLGSCVSGTAIVLIQLCDSFQLISFLRADGVPEMRAMAMKGIYDRGQPLIQVGLVFATALSMSVVPLMSGKKGKTDLAGLALKIGLAAGSAGALGLFVIMEPLNVMLFDNNQGTVVLRLLSLAVLPASVVAVSGALLQSKGRIGASAFGVLSGVAVKAISNFVLIPSLHTTGAALSTLLSLTFSAVLLWRMVAGKERLIPVTGDYFLRLAGSLFVMSVIAGLFLFLCSKIICDFSASRAISAIGSLGATGLGFVAFLFSAIRLRLFSVEEWAYMPFGSRLLAMLPEETNQSDQSGNSGGNAK